MKRWGDPGASAASRACEGPEERALGFGAGGDQIVLAGEHLLSGPGARARRRDDHEAPRSQVRQENAVLRGRRARAVSPGDDRVLETGGAQVRWIEDDVESARRVPGEAPGHAGRGRRSDLAGAHSPRPRDRVRGGRGSGGRVESGRVGRVRCGTRGSIPSVPARNDRRNRCEEGQGRDPDAHGPHSELTKSAADSSITRKIRHPAIEGYRWQSTFP
jgi:hypothetical protein